MKLDLQKKNEIEKKEASKWLKQIAKPANIWVKLTVLTAMCSGLLLILQMYWIASIVYGAFIEKLTVSDMKWYFIVIFITIIVRAFLVFLKEKISFNTSKVVRNNIRKELLDHLENLGPTYSKQHGTANVISTLTEQVESLNNYFVFYLPQMSLAVYMPILILCFVFPISATSGFIFLICAPLIPFFMALVGMGAASLNQKNFVILSKMSTIFLDTIQGLVTLKLMGRSKQRTAIVYESSELYRKKTMEVLRVAFLSSVVLEVFAASSIAFIAIYLGMGYINHGLSSTSWWSLEITLQGGLFILLVAPEFFLSLRELGTHYHARAEAIGATIEIQKVLKVTFKNNNDNVIESYKKSNNIAINFKNVSMKYSDEMPLALNDITFNVNANEKVAIVGASGSGKSTLLNLCLKFITNISGEININNQKLNNISTKSWYDEISYLGQNLNLLSGTLRENLTISDKNITDEQCLIALENANLSSWFKSVKYGLNMEISELNSGVSGGQAQRIGIARMLLKRSSLWLLDEPTSSLDADYEEKILQNMMKLWDDKTVLFLTHRYDLLCKFEKILVLDKGKIVEFDSFENLSNNNDSFLMKLFQKGIL